MDRHQKDIDWLGDDAPLAPVVRAALGILLEAGDWQWWDDPSLLDGCLERALSGHLPAKWGGDSTVWHAERWLDPSLAVMLAEAFVQHPRFASLKIRVVRSVWAWKESDSLAGEMLSAITGELAALVGVGQVFPEWQRNARPRYPEVTGSQQQKCVVSAPSQVYSADGWRAGFALHARWEPDATLADIVITDSVAALYKLTAARLVVIYDMPVDLAFSQVNVLRSRLCAQCAVHVSAQEGGVKPWLEGLIEAWAEGKTFAQALATTSHLTGITAQVLASTQTFMISRHVFPGGADKPRGKHARKDDTELISIEQSVRLIAGRAGETALQAPVPPPVERVLDVWASQNARRASHWPLKGAVNIAVQICVKSPLRDRQLPFPDDKVAWEGDSKVLQVHMFEYARAPQTLELTLPRKGNSPVLQFTREPTEGPVDLRFMVTDGAQILQTARLNAALGETIQFSIENIISPLLDRKKRFDVGLLVNQSLGDQPSVTIISGTGEATLHPLFGHETGDARDRLLQALQQAVANPSADLRPLLIKLADLGALFHRHIKAAAPDWPGCGGRLQLVTQSDAFFPIEYLYDGVTVESPDAPLCSERAHCLKAEQAKPGCEWRGSGEVLCPMGFLGVSGVIERHTWQAGLEPRQWTRHPRQRIDDLSRIAFTASDQADRFRDADVHPHEVVRIATIESALGVKRISDWGSWKDHIQHASPSLLLMVVHLSESKVHTGAGDQLMLSGMGVKHVGRAPVVVAIGCSSGLGEIPGGSLPAILKRNGVSVVIAAMTQLLGRHANRVARDLADHLRKAAQAPGSRYVGDIVSRLRRQLLADDLALGLAVVAFGDADIVLGGQSV